jgi:hypothetical protein
MRRWLTVVAGALLTVCVGAGISAGDEGGALRLLGDRGYWASFDWDAVGKSSLMASVPWTEPGHPDSPFRYEHRLDLEGVPVTLYALKNVHRGGSLGDLAILHTTPDKGQHAAHAARLRAWCTGRFGGDARVVSDRLIYRTQTFVTTYAYWETGATLVRLMAQEIEDNGVRSYVSAISFLDARHNRVKPPEIVLSCALDTRKHGPELVEYFPEQLLYKIDVPEHRVKDWDDNVISDELNLSDSLYTFSRQSGSMATINIINRKTGEFSYKLFFSTNLRRESPDMVITGLCRTISPAR